MKARKTGAGTGGVSEQLAKERANLVLKLRDEARGLPFDALESSLDPVRAFLESNGVLH